MIKEYAVEPEFMTIENILPFFISNFGFDKGRVVSKFPKKWLKIVYESFNEVPTMKKKLIEVGLGALKNKKCLVPSNRPYNNKFGWLENAIIQQSQKPFHAIISTKENVDHEYVLSLEKLHQGDPLFYENHSGRIIIRSADQIAEEIYSLAKFSKKLILVDPYFSNLQDRQIRPLINLFRKIVKDDLNIELELHTSDQDFNEDYFIERLSQIVPVSLTITVIVWPYNEMHNRYALTENGGILFGTGLDDNELGNSTNDDDLVLLDSSQHHERWEKYNNSTKSKIVIIGRNSNL